MPVELAISLMLGANLGGGLIAVGLTRNAAGRGAAHRASAICCSAGSGRRSRSSPSTCSIPRSRGSGRDAARQVVNLHLGFNVALLVLCLPLTGPVARLVTKLVKPKPTPEQLANPLAAAASALDQSVIGVPALALASATRELLRMAEIIERMLKPLMELYETGDPEKIKQAKRLEEAVDAAQSDIKLYLARITYAGEDDARRGHELSSFAINLEHVGDAISKTLLKLAETRRDQKLQFSPEGWRELNELHHRVMGNMQLALNVLVSKDRESARQLLRRRTRWDRPSARATASTCGGCGPARRRVIETSQHPPRDGARAEDHQLALRVGRLPDPARERRPARQPPRRQSLASTFSRTGRRNVHARLARGSRRPPARAARR